MDDRQTFAALCAQPQSIFRPENSNSTLCCNDVVELIRARVCTPRLWGISQLRARAAFYDMGTSTWSPKARMNHTDELCVAQVAGRGWLSFQSKSHDSIFFIEPSRALSVVAVPFQGVLLPSTYLTHVSDCVVTMHHADASLTVQTTPANLDDLVAGHGCCTTLQLEDVRGATAMAVVPCGRGALFGLRDDYAPRFRYFDIDSCRVLAPLSECPRNIYSYGIQAMPVLAGVELWEHIGPVALYDSRERRWQSYAHESPADVPGMLDSVASIDTNLVACLMHGTNPRSFLRFYDRRAMSFVPHSDSVEIAADLDAMISL